MTVKYEIYLASDTIEIVNDHVGLCTYGISEEEKQAIVEAFEMPQFWDMFVGSILASIEDTEEVDVVED